jgi:membrane-bound serine protease (ClpP class)
MAERRWRTYVLAALLLLAALPGQAGAQALPAAEAGEAAPAGSAAPAPQATRPVGWITIADAIHPATAGFFDRALRWAQREGCEALVVELDTPGGLDTSMRRMVKGILASPVPVIVYVSPSGSRAASAGVFLMMAAHVAAMAPGTNLGAAHPVAIGGGLTGGEAQPDTTMIAKVTNDAVAYVRSLAEQRGRNADWAEEAVRQSVSVSAEEALEIQVIDLIAPSAAELLRALDGREIEVLGTPRRLATAGAPIIEKHMNLRDQVLGAIANPNVAYLLLLLGVLGIFFELSHPGSLFPGIVGAVALLLAFFALQMLPVRAAGIALIVLSVILFLLEIKVTSYGALSIGGVAALLFGSLMLFETNGTGIGLSWSVVLPSVIIVGGLFIFAVAMAIRAQTRKTATGREGLVGEIGESLGDFTDRGRVFVHGEIWNATSRRPVRRGQRVRVRGVNGMEIEVEPLEESTAT